MICEGVGLTDELIDWSRTTHESAEDVRLTDEAIDGLIDWSKTHESPEEVGLNDELIDVLISVRLMILQQR